MLLRKVRQVARKKKLNKRERKKKIRKKKISRKRKRRKKKANDISFLFKLLFFI